MGVGLIREGCFVFSLKIRGNVFLCKNMSNLKTSFVEGGGDGFEKNREHLPISSKLFGESDKKINLKFY